MSKRINVIDITIIAIGKQLHVLITKIADNVRFAFASPDKMSFMIEKKNPIPAIIAIANIMFV